MSGVDALIVTALREEFEAVRDAAMTGYAGNPGVDRWEVHGERTSTPYQLGRYVMADGSRFSVALARPTRMGTTAIAPVAGMLVERLSPRCVANCGVCAGNPASTAPGDVIVAEMAYVYDEGRRTANGFEGDHRQFPMPPAWVRTAQDMSPVDLPSHGRASDEDATLWLLERLYSGVDPRGHPARPRYFTEDAWRTAVGALQARGLLGRMGAELALTESGWAFVERAVYDDVRDRGTLPFGILVGPMASGNAVVRDGRTWQQLRAGGVRTVLGLELEAAAVAGVAHRLEVPGWAVVKGVMDHADSAKDDRYKGFAARASAEVLLKLLALRLATATDLGAEPARSRTAEPTPTIALRPGTVPVGLDAVNGTLVVADDAGISGMRIGSHAVLWQWRTRWRSVAYSAGSGLIANGVAQTLTLIDRNDVRRRLDAATKVPISRVALSADGLLVAVGAAVPLGGGDAEVELRRTYDGAVVHRLHGLTATVRDLTFSSDGLLLAACDDHGGVRVWDVAGGRAIGEVPRHMGTRTLAFSQRATLLAVGAGHAVQLWEGETGAVVRTLELRDDVIFVGFAFAGQVLIAGSRSGEARAWSTRTWKHHDQLSRSSVIAGSTATGFAIGVDGGCLAVGADNGTIRVWYPRRPDGR